MTTISYLKSLDDAEENEKLAKKLPHYIADRWRRMVDRCLYAREQRGYVVQPNGHYPNFAEFCKFVSDEARIACGPCNTRYHQPDEKNQEKTSRQRKAGMFATQTGPPARENNGGKKISSPATCTFCKGPHVVSKCDSFLKLDVDTKKAFALHNGLCFGCLRRNHLFRDCRSKDPTLMADKKQSATCNAEKAQPDNGDKTPGKNCKKDDQRTAVAHRVMTGVQDGDQEQSSERVLHSLVLPVIVSHPDSPDEVITYALLDSMSDTCFVTENLVKTIKPKGVPTSLEVTTMTSKMVIATELFTGLTIRGVNETTILQLPKAYRRDEIPVERSLIPRPESVRSWTHLRDVADSLLPYRDDLEVGLLIGASCSAAMLPKRVVAGRDHEPYAMKTPIGWGVIGWMPSFEKSSQYSRTYFVHRTTTRETSPLEVKKMFEIEFNESVKGERISIEDKEFLKGAKAGIHHRQDGHFEMPLPLKRDVQLPNNKPLAIKRLRQLKGKMLKNQKYREDYIRCMKEVIEKGYAEAVPPNQLAGTPGRIWYIPHHGVYHPQKTNKLRVVYDCSAEYEAKSLNRQLLQGPDLTNSLIGILCRFRQEPVAVTCDIEGMYHQVGVNIEDRDFLRFLWWDDGDVTKEPTEYRMTVHVFGATSSPACANFALKTTADMFEQEHGRSAADFVRRDFYVDDGLKSVRTPESAIELIQSTTDLCKAGGFRLHRLACNEKSVVERIPEDSRAKNIQAIDLKYDVLPIERTLGIEWCLEADAFQFRITLSEKPTSRRGILSTISSIYDPLGLVSPVLLIGRRILQEICRDGNGWDDPIDENLVARWERWKMDILRLSELKIPRCYHSKMFGSVNTVQLHHFSDASQNGYGQCSYVRLTNDANQVTTSLVMAKSRVAPTKALTIPRLELTAALTSAKVSEFLNSELSYENVRNFYWTDSQVALGYINNEAKRFQVFVANRVQQIRDRTNAIDWNYVETSCNPADLASRGTTSKELMGSQLWWQGPRFLSSNEPRPIKTEFPMVSSEDPELKKTTVHRTTTKISEYADLPTRLEYFSDWHRARRAVAICQQFIRLLKDRSLKQKWSGVSVEMADILEAEKVIIRAEQQKHLSECYRFLQQLDAYSFGRREARQRRDTLKLKTNLYRLDPYLSTDKLIRVGGRIRRADIPRDQAHPIIVPSGHISRLLINYYRKKLGHAGKSATLGELRAAGYWVLRGRAAVSNLIFKCVTCRKLRCSPATQKMADLPADRLEPSPSFTYAGVDFFGPFYVKEGRSQRKRWGCLFTCLVMRAIHIEVAANLSTDSFLNAFRRFIGRRAPVRILRCDRGTNFVGAKAELTAAVAEMDHARIKGEMLTEGCDLVEFNMNVPYASHMGGVWERMIRSARVALASLLDQHASSLDDELLHTLMIEAEAFVNSRPLTFLESDAEPLTPFQLLTLKSKAPMPPPGHFVREDLYCRKRWRRVQHLANEFWTRWLKECLPSLQKRQKWIRTQDNMEVGDIVMLVDQAIPRGQWPKAIITQTHHSEDGLVRKVTVKTSNSQYERPIDKVIMLYKPESCDKETIK